MEQCLASEGGVIRSVSKILNSEVPLRPYQVPHKGYACILLL